MDSSVSPKDEIWFLCVCHHISNTVYTCLPDCPVALYQFWCPVSVLTVFSTLNNILHFNALLCISICEVITYWGWCRIESHSLQYNMVIVYRTREMHFTCAKPYWGHMLVCLFLEPDCHMSCRLGSVLSAKCVQKCLPLLTDWTHQINSSNLPLFDLHNIWNWLSVGKQAE